MQFALRPESSQFSKRLLLPAPDFLQVIKSEAEMYKQEKDEVIMFPHTTPRTKNLILK